MPYYLFNFLSDYFIIQRNTQEIPREFIIHSCVYFLAIFQIVTPANISLFEISNDNMKCYVVWNIFSVNCQMDSLNYALSSSSWTSPKKHKKFGSCVHFCKCLFCKSLFEISFKSPFQNLLWQIPVEKS